MKVSAPALPSPDPAVTSDTTEISATDPISTPGAAEARWPEWFKPVDVALAILVTILAFLLASYTARNSDIWRHMSTGRLIVQGQYPVGGDPLSFTGADRAWVNSNWIFDLLMYAAYRADDSGACSVVLKALAFAAAFAVLFLLRRPEQSLWPWAMMIALGAVACGSLASLRPMVFGMLLQSVVLASIYRGNWLGHKWRMPAILGGICWIWACTDSFFFLGPLTILLALVGEKIQSQYLAGQAESVPTGDPFWPAPPQKALGRALLLSIVGVLLNPTFLGAVVRNPLDAFAQLIPFELTFGWSDIFAKDNNLLPVVLSPLSPQYFDSVDRGANIPGYSAAALVVIGGLLLGGGMTRLRATHVLFWFGYVALALVNFRFIPSAVIVAIPLAAAHLNGLSRFKLLTVIDPTTRTILTLSGVGRIVSIALLLGLIAATIPGFLHVRGKLQPALQRRMSWGIEDDAGLSRAAKLLQQWREDGSLPPESRGLLSFHELGDYCAWHAPLEKVFINSRFRFHSPELVDLASLRDEFRKAPTEDELKTQTSNGNLKTMADKYRADYFAIGQWMTPLQVEMIIRLTSDFNGGNGRSDTVLLHLDGRVAVIQRTDTAAGRETAQKLSYTYERAAFSPDAPPVSSGKSTAPLEPVEGWIAEFMTRPQPGSVATDDALLFMKLGRYSSEIAKQNWIAGQNRSVMGGYGAGPAIQFALQPGPQLPNTEEIALPILANRAARRAIVETPDDPSPYLTLADSYSLRYLGTLNPKDPDLQQMTSLHRFLDRLPASPNGGELSKNAITARLKLFILHYNYGQIDTALDVLSKASDDIKNAPETMLQFLVGELKSASDFFRQKSIESQYELQPGSLDGIVGRGDTAVAKTIMTYRIQRMQSEGRRPPNKADGMKMYESIISDLASSDLDANEHSQTPKPKDAAWVKSHAQSLEDRVKRDKSKRIEAYNQMVKTFGFSQKFLAAAQLGLTDRAVDMVLSTTDWDNVPQSGLDLRVQQQGVAMLQQRFTHLASTSAVQDMKDGSVVVHTSAVGLNLQAISMQLESGNLDKAAQQLDNVVKVLEKAEQDNPGDPQLKANGAAVKQLRLLQARFEGNFEKMAEDTREQLQQIPKLDTAKLEQLKIPLVALRPPLAALAGCCIVLVDPVGQMRAALAQEAVLHFDLGMTALQAGDNKQARERFASALKPQGVPVDFLNIDTESALVFYATRYSALLDKFADPKQR